MLERKREREREGGGRDVSEMGQAAALHGVCSTVSQSVVLKVQHFFNVLKVSILQ